MAGAALLAGCAGGSAPPLAVRPAAERPVVGRVGYVDLGRLVRVHPFYPQFAHYDQALAALRATQALPGLDPRVSEIDRDRRLIGDAFNAASRRMQTLSQAKSGAYALRERKALNAALASPTLTNGNAPNGLRLATDYRQEYSAMRGSENADIARYGSDLFQEEEHTLTQVAASMQQRVDQSYAQREAQFREAEATLSLNMSRRDAHQILMLRVRLEDLHLPQADRQIAAAQLSAIRQRERAELSALERRDDATLSAYRVAITRETAALASRTVADIRARFAANYSARLEAARAQASLQPLSLPRMSDAPALGLRDAATLLQASTSTALADGTTETLSAFGKARSAMNARFVALRAADANSSVNLHSQILTLQRERQALRDEIVAFIMRDANAVARSRDIATVRLAKPKSGYTDLTAAVRSDLVNLGTR